MTKSKQKIIQISKEELNKSTKKILQLKESTSNNFIEIGKELKKIQESLPYGEWKKWVEEELNFSYRTARRFIQIFENPEIREKHDIWGNKKEERSDVNVTSVSIPKHFQIIYADPPWEYNFSKSDNRKIENQYPTMNIGEIKNLRLETEDNAILFLWATAPKLREALEVMEAWGFEYKTHAIWDKEILGMGYWFRNQHELLLVGTKGNVHPPEESLRISSILKSKRSEHSKKPEEFYEIIEKMFPDTKYLELFARNKRRNWASWGNEI